MSPLEKQTLGFSPYVRFAARPCRGNWHVGNRILRDYLLFYVESGRGELNLAGEKVPLKPDSWYWAPPKMIVPYIHFDLVYRKEFAGLPMAPPGYLDKNDPGIQPSYFVEGPVRLLGKVQPRVFGEAYEVLHRIIHLFERQSPYHQTECSGLVLQLLANFLRGGEAEDQHGPASIAREIETILVQRFQENPSLADLAKLTGYNGLYLARVFKKYKGLSPTQYVRRLKINKAKDLLLHSNLTMTAIALECGFANSALFSRTFHDLEGRSPTEYLKGKSQV
jgi:AraC-like DNA-binding protein